MRPTEYGFREFALKKKKNTTKALYIHRQGCSLIEMSPPAFGTSVNSLSPAWNAFLFYSKATPPLGNPIWALRQALIPLFAENHQSVNLTNLYWVPCLCQVQGWAFLGFNISKQSPLPSGANEESRHTNELLGPSAGRIWMTLCTWIRGRRRARP